MITYILFYFIFLSFLTLVNVIETKAVHTTMYVAFFCYSREKIHIFHFNK